MTSTVFTYKSARASLRKVVESHYVLTNVYSMERGQGHARGLLETIFTYADENNLTISLTVQRYGYADGRSPTNKGLEELYSKYGFVRKPEQRVGHPIEMIRLPFAG